VRKKILFMGLGRMGGPMAGHIAKACAPEGELAQSYSVSVYNRSPEKATQWCQRYAGQIWQAAAAQERFDLMILCIGKDEDVREALCVNPGLFSHIKKNGIIIDHTTTSVRLAQDMAALAKEKGVSYLDAPVSGGEDGAIKGALTCMVGGDADDMDKVRPVLNSYCRAITYIGQNGAGQMTKMANQLCIAGVLAGLSEAITLLDKAGIDMDQAFSAIKNGSAQSWQMDNRFATMIQQQFDFGFAIDNMIKDMQYALQQAEEQGWTPQISQQILALYKTLSEQGRGQQDSSALVMAL